LVYRFNQLNKAIENAQKLGFTNGAALYPMVTMNGEECHNEWEITFEEIHRNGAIAYAIYNYVRYTGDAHYLSEYGWDVLLGIARFWSQRVHWSEARKQYVMHGVTGPNEYENNVNNNWYTNYFAKWCIAYTMEVMEYLRTNYPDALASKIKQYAFDEVNETARWKDIVAHIYLGQMEHSEIRIQHDGFLDKELAPASALPEAQRPINQHWSWDRILRSCYIKQADVLQGMYFFDEDFDKEVIRANFDFYEPMTVHESSLSPCVHSILASQLGLHEKAYEMYMRTSRLDLDDYNHEAHEGLHITSMAGTWMSIVQGFGGMRVKDGQLTFHPILPAQWKAYSFNVLFRGSVVKVSVDQSGHEVTGL
jgi:maltose phosphorylase